MSHQNNQQNKRVVSDTEIKCDDRGEEIINADMGSVIVFACKVVSMVVKKRDASSFSDVELAVVM